jgi:hypothetical protein
LAQLLEKFVETASLEGHYFVSGYEERTRIARMLEDFPALTLKQRFVLLFAPVAFRDVAVSDIAIQESLL